MYNRNLILRNTLLLYGRMLLTVWLNLWATRLTLQHLGVDDLGVYGVVGSVVSMFGIFTNGVSTAVQRFVTFELGRGCRERVQQVFCTSLSLLLVLAGILVVLAEGIGLWLLHTQLQIPDASMEAAQWVFQFTVVAFVANLLAIPYNALVIARERMDVFAVISVVQVALNCAAAWSLSFFDGGRLAVYGGTMAGIAVLVRLLYQGYCYRHFPEVRFRWSIKGDEVRALTRFAGISTLSGVLQLASGEGIILLFNLTFGVAVNAVYAIALQLKNMVLSFALNVFKAIQPQITKTYAEGDIEAHRRLVSSGSKIEVYLCYLLLLPLLFRTEQVMQLWLGEVPAHGVAFARGVLFISLTYAAFEPIRTAVLATGRIARFMLVPDVVYLFVLPVGYLVARLTDDADMLLRTVVIMDVAACAMRVVLGVRVSPLRMGKLLRHIVLPCAVVGLLGSAVCSWLSCLFADNLVGIIAYWLVCIIAILLIVGLVQCRELKHWLDGVRDSKPS